MSESHEARDCAQCGATYYNKHVCDPLDVLRRAAHERSDTALKAVIDLFEELQERCRALNERCESLGSRIYDVANP